MVAVHGGIVNQAIKALNQGIDELTDYVKANGFAIAVLLGVVWFFKTQYKTRSQGHVLSSGPKTTTASSSSNLSREEQVRQVRLRQQELVNQRAKEAEKLRKQKEALEQERRNHSAKPTQNSAGDTGRTLDSAPTTTTSSSSSASGGYNPMQPWTANSSGYRPTRRTVRA